jgi:hypothetical protein
MATDKNLTENTTQNFILKAFNSIQIGLYILLASYVINDSILGFVADSNPLGMLSIEIIETICLFMIVLVGFFSMLAVFFSSRRASRKAGDMVWNAASKKQFLSYFVSFVLGVFLLVFAKNSAINYATPFFLLYLGLVLSVLNTHRKKEYYLLVAVAILLAIVVYVIPTYWYSSLLIVGGSFFVYGIAIRK